MCVQLKWQGPIKEGEITLRHCLSTVSFYAHNPMRTKTFAYQMLLREFFENSNPLDPAPLIYIQLIFHSILNLKNGGRSYF